MHDVVRLHLRVLGPLAVAPDMPPAEPIRLSGKKAVGLLAFLALSPSQSASRDQLAGLLWSDDPEPRARQSLRQALTVLRRQLPMPVLDTEGDVVHICPGALTVDALELERLSRSDGMVDLERAVDLIRGELLAGFSLQEEGFDAWMEQQRRRFDLIAAQVLERHAELCDRDGNGAAALASAERLVAIDPLSERWQRMALRIHARHHGAKSALERATGIIDLLRRELDVGPEPETRKLIEAIREGVVARTEASAPPPALDLEPPHTTDERPEATDAAIPDGTEHSNPASAPLPSRRPTWLRPRAGAGALAAVLLIGAAGILHRSAFWQRTAPEPPPREITGEHTPTDPWQSPHLQQRADSSPARGQREILPIAVLPFTTPGDDSAGRTGLLSELVWDDLINTLSRIPTLRVISRQTARSYRGQPIDVAAIGAELAVRYVLEGSLRLQDDRLRINVELVDTGTRLPVWLSRFDRADTDSNGVLDEIVGRLARELQLGVFTLESRRNSADPEVPVLNYKGFTAIFSASTSGPRALAQAEGYFKEALTRDPSNTVAKRGLGAYHTLIGVQMLTADGEVHLRKAEALLRQAIEEAPEVNSPYFFIGMIHEARLELAEALSAYRRSLEINPSYAPAYAQAGHVLLALGQARDGLEHIRYAMRLSPRDPHRSHWLRFVGEAELELGNARAAIEHLWQAYELNPRQPQTLRSLIAAHAVSGRMDEGHSAWSELRAAAPHLTAERVLKRPTALQTTQPELYRGLRMVLSPAASGP